jgi:hypothetical protein
MKIACVSHKNLIEEIPFFHNKEEAFIADFVLFLNPLKVGPRELIYEKGSYPNLGKSSNIFSPNLSCLVYFIMTGKVGFVEGSQCMVFKTMVPGGYFGEIEIFEDCSRSQ